MPEVTKICFYWAGDFGLYFVFIINPSMATILDNFNRLVTQFSSVLFCILDAFITNCPWVCCLSTLQHDCSASYRTIPVCTKAYTP